MKQCIKCLWETNRRELESTLFKLLIILPHSQSEWHKDMFSFDHIKLSVHYSLPATASTLLTQHGAFFPLTFTDVSSDPHASELQAEIKGKKKSPSIPLPADPDAEAPWQLSASASTSLQACFEVLAWQEVLLLDPQLLGCHWQKHQVLLTHFLWIIQLCAMPTSGLPFGRFPPNLGGPAEQPAVLLGLSSSWKSQQAQGQGCLTLPVASGGSSMAGQGSSSCLELFWELPSFGTVWEIAFRRYNPSKDLEVSSKQRARQFPNEGVSGSLALERRRKQPLCSLLPVRRAMLKESEKVKDSHPTTSSTPLHLATEMGNRPLSKTASVRGSFQCGSSLAAGKIAHWPHSIILFWLILSFACLCIKQEGSQS